LENRIPTMPDGRFARAGANETRIGESLISITHAMWEGSGTLDANMKRALIAGLAIWVAAGSAAALPDTPQNPYESGIAPKPVNEIDRLVFGRLEKLGIQPADVCPDAVFVRRAYLDVIGTLPKPKEVSAFLKDDSPKKRAALIDELMKREEFVDYWTMKWCDLLRVKAEFPINLWPNAVQAYHRWIHTAVRDNLPLDRFARELLTASGSNFRVGPVNFYRAVQSKNPEGIAQAVALTFMGERADKWPKEKLADFAGFFAQTGFKSTAEWKEEIVYFDPAKTNAQGNVTTSAKLPDGTLVQFPPGRDPRAVFVDWLVTEKNPVFARTLANRMWSWLMGRGIVEAPDDFRADNPPSNPELLAYLEKELIRSKWDVRQVFKLILSSATYQLSSIAKSDRAEAAANFASYPLRRLDAEVLIDALNQITGTSEKYSSAIPEPFTYVPEEERSIELGDGSITSSFLEMFGRPSRDTGMEEERSNKPSSDQELHLLNSSHIRKKIEQGPRIQAVLRDAKLPRDAVAGLYLLILSRNPTAEELRTITDYSQKSNLKPRDVGLDLAWALINSAEFLYRH
jgi:hypothetical protein